MTPQNLVFFLTESHGAQLLQAAGHPLIKTPNIDRLAARGVRFEQAYCNSPICVPSRSAIATGKYPHQTGHWDNSHAFHGDHPSWMSTLRDREHDVVGIGKYHFRSAEDDNGFSREIDTMHLLEGKGELIGLLRANGEEPVRRNLWETYTVDIGAGDGSVYQDYDEKVVRNATTWLKDKAAQPQADPKPWVLSVNFVSAHPPFKVPQRLLDLYPLEDIPLPKAFFSGERPHHPALEHLRTILGHEGEIDADRARLVIASYFALITLLDEKVGEVLDVLEETGLSANTRVLYSSDHGYNYGDRYLFGLFNFYEQTARIPLIVAGPGIPEGETRREIVSHVDLFPTILDLVGAGADAVEQILPGRSLLPAILGADRQRIAFAENHAAGTASAAYMLRKGDYKLIYHAGMPAQLFDLKRDSAELEDLAESREHQAILADLVSDLRTILDPEATDRAAKDAQQSRIAELGGKDEILRLRGSFGFSPPPSAS